jgi:hypothetical protein
MSTAQALLSELPEGEAIPLPWVRERVGWSYREQSYAVQSGAIRPLPRKGPHGGYRVTRDDAILILVASLLAAAAGVAIVAMIRALQGTGIDPETLAQAMQT